MTTSKLARAKALVLLGILATTGMAMAKSVPPVTPNLVTYINGQPTTGCQLPTGAPCSQVPLLGNQGTTITPSAACTYNAFILQNNGEIVTTSIVSAGPGHCCTSLSNTYPLPQCPQSYTPPTP